MFAINPRTQQLVEQFKPQIEAIKPLHRRILVLLAEGVKTRAALQKTLKVKEILPELVKLQKQGLITEDNKLTELGEILAMILRLLPEVEEA